METQLEKRMREIAREEINKAFEELGKRLEAAAVTTAHPGLNLTKKSNEMKKNDDRNFDHSANARQAAAEYSTEGKIYL